MKPVDDPRQALTSAIRYSWLMAALMGAVALTSLGDVVLRLRAGRGVAGISVLLAVLSVLWIAPGVIYALVAIHLRRRALWACNIGIAVAFLQILFYGGAVLLGMVLSVVSGRVRTAEWIIMLLLFLLAAALSVLIRLAQPRSYCDRVDAGRSQSRV